MCMYLVLVIDAIYAIVLFAIFDNTAAIVTYH